MLLLWLVGFLWVSLIGLGTLLCVKQIKKTSLLFISIMALVFGWLYATFMYIPLNSDIYQFWIFSISFLVLFVSIIVLSNDIIETRSFKILGVSILVIVFILFVITSVKFEKAVDFKKGDVVCIIKNKSLF